MLVEGDGSFLSYLMIFFFKFLLLIFYSRPKFLKVEISAIYRASIVLHK